MASFSNNHHWAYTFLNPWVLSKEKTFPPIWLFVGQLSHIHLAKYESLTTNICHNQPKFSKPHCRLLTSNLRLIKMRWYNPLNSFSYNLCKCTYLFLLNNSKLHNKWRLTSKCEQMVFDLRLCLDFWMYKSSDSIMQSLQADKLYCSLTVTLDVWVPCQGPWSSNRESIFTKTRHS